MILPIWLFLVIALILILSALLGAGVRLVYTQEVCPMQSACVPCIAPTGQQGENGFTGGSSIATGTGPTGDFGIPIQPDSFGVLTPAIMNQIATTYSTYQYLVTQDLRPVITNNWSGHLIYWNGTSFIDWGQYTGPSGQVGGTGDTGGIGLQGTTGPPGVPGSLGPPGASITGPPGAFPSNQIPTGGGIFGAGQDGSLLVASNTTLFQDGFFSTVVVDAGETLFTNGYRVFASQSITNNGVIANYGQNGPDSIPNGTGASGAPAGSMGGGGFGGLGSFLGPATGGPSLYAFSTGSVFAGGVCTGVENPTLTPSGGWAGELFLNATGINAAMLCSIFYPVRAPTGLQIFPISGGAGGGGESFAYNGTIKSGAGSGGGVIALSTPQIAGSGVIDVHGGNSGNLISGDGVGSGGGGGGLILIHTLTNNSSWTFNVSGGISIISGAPNSSGNGLPGRFIFC